MATKYRGKLRQPFKITIDIEPLMEYLSTEIIKGLQKEKGIEVPEIDEYYGEDNNIIMTGSYDAEFSGTYYPATYYEPAEDDMDRPYIGNEAGFLLEDIPEEIRKLIRISDFEEDEEDAEVLE